MFSSSSVVSGFEILSYQFAMTILVTGSLAYDIIMTHDGKFTDNLILDKLDNLNVSFFIHTKEKEFGGCGGNIVYNLSLFGGEVDMIGRAGKDFFDYEEWLTEIGINTDHVIIHDDIDTAVAYITTDSLGNQITSFYPGAMRRPDKFRPGVSKKYNLAIIAPEDADWMMQAVKYCEGRLPFIFDPGQQVASLTGEELREGILKAQVVVVNSYEFELLKEKTGLSKKELVQKIPTLIVTKSEKGSDIYNYGKHINIGIAIPREIKDPTGVGDAYRAGIITGMSCGFGWELTGQVAATAASFAIEEYGTQNHYFEPAEFNERLKKNFGQEINFE